MKTWQAIILSTLVGFLFAGIVVLIAGRPRGEPIRLGPPPTPGPIVVYVTGEVNRPGVYSLPDGSRIQDAIQAAGGATNQGNLLPMNLAAPLQDGMRIWIPSVNTPTPLTDTRSSPVEKATRPAPSKDNPLNINIASQEELEMLPEIGEARASAIIEYRTQNGLFTRLDDLKNVNGITPSVFDRIKDLITLESPP